MVCNLIGGIELPVLLFFSATWSLIFQYLSFSCIIQSLCMAHISSLVILTGRCSRPANLSVRTVFSGGQDLHIWRLLFFGSMLGSVLIGVSSIHSDNIVLRYPLHLDRVVGQQSHIQDSNPRPLILSMAQKPTTWCNNHWVVQIV